MTVAFPAIALTAGLPLGHDGVQEAGCFQRGAVVQQRARGEARQQLVARAGRPRLRLDEPAPRATARSAPGKRPRALVGLPRLPWHAQPRTAAHRSRALVALHAKLPSLRYEIN